MDLSLASPLLSNASQFPGSPFLIADFFILGKGIYPFLKPALGKVCSISKTTKELSSLYPFLFSLYPATCLVCLLTNPLIASVSLNGQYIKSDGCQLWVVCAEPVSSHYHPSPIRHVELLEQGFASGSAWLQSPREPSGIVTPRNTTSICADAHLDSLLPLGGVQMICLESTRLGSSLLLGGCSAPGPGSTQALQAWTLHWQRWYLSGTFIWG